MKRDNYYRQIWVNNYCQKLDNNLCVPFSPLHAGWVFGVCCGRVHHQLRLFLLHVCGGLRPGSGGWHLSHPRLLHGPWQALSWSHASSCELCCELRGEDKVCVEETSPSRPPQGSCFLQNNGEKEGMWWMELGLQLRSERCSTHTHAHTHARKLACAHTRTHARTHTHTCTLTTHVCACMLGLGGHRFLLFVEGVKFSVFGRECFGLVAQDNNQ